MHGGRHPLQAVRDRQPGRTNTSPAPADVTAPHKTPRRPCPRPPPPPRQLRQRRRCAGDVRLRSPAHLRRPARARLCRHRPQCAGPALLHGTTASPSHHATLCAAPAHGMGRHPDAGPARRHPPPPPQARPQDCPRPSGRTQPPRLTPPAQVRLLVRSAGAEGDGGPGQSAGAGGTVQALSLIHRRAGLPAPTAAGQHPSRHSCGM